MTTLKGYVDEAVEPLKEKVNKIKPIIAASASYQGDLIKGKYQFTFGGNSKQNYKNHDMYNGFLMPQSGYIKRFVFQCTGFKLLIPQEEFSDFNFERLQNKPLILFSLFLIKSVNNEVLKLGALSITLNNIFVREGNMVPSYDYSFISDLPYEVEKYKIDAKDILNIRSEITNDKNENKEEKVNIIRIHTVDDYIKAEDFFTYLTTILIELDPL